MDRATRYRAGVTALTFAAAVACWIFSLEPWAGTFAFMGALFAMTTVMMQRRKLL
jgi:hypothetical protein